MKFRTINTLNDDILFGIFNHYRLDPRNAWNFRLGWSKISQRWRHLVHSLAFHLDMHIHCTNGTPIMDTLDHLPPLPLFIDYRDTTATISRQDERAIGHALVLWDRVRRIDLHLPPSILHKFLMLMDDLYSRLEHLSIKSTIEEDIKLVFPKTFLAPNLRHLTLLGIDLPERFRLLSSTVSFVTLVLSNIRASGYFLPRPLVAHLWSLHQLEELTIEFSIPLPRPSAERELSGKLATPVTLPNLKRFRFQGVSAYLECILAQIRAPLLERLDITLFNQLAFALPHLSRLIDTTVALKLPTATVCFGNEVTIFTDHDITQGCGGPFTLRVMCQGLDWQIDCAGQICGALMIPLSSVQKLRLDFDRPMMPTEWENGEIDGTTWHEFLMSFVGVNELRICSALSQELSRALRMGEVGSDPGFLPSLQEIRFHGTKDNLFGSFIRARQVAGRPVRLLPRRPPSTRSGPVQAESRLVTSSSSIHPGEYTRISSEIHILKNQVDPVVNLNNFLQQAPEGNVTHELRWAMTQEGQNNQAVHTAAAMFRNVSLGIGKGVLMGQARRAAAEMALAYLAENGIPVRSG